MLARLRMLALGSISFFALGILLVMLGTHQAALARDLGLDLEQSGFLGASLALGLGAGVILGGPLYDRLPRRSLLLGSLALTGVLLLSAAPDAGYSRMVALVLAAGLTSGIYDTVVNALIAERHGATATRAIALAHASATLGATLGPLLMRHNPLGADWPAAFHGLGYLHLGIAAVSALAPFPAAVSGQRASAPPGGSALWRSPVLLALGLVGFAYVGVENGLTVFAVPWAQSRGASEAVGQTSISAFWLGLLCGRLLLVLRQPAQGAPLLAAGGVLAATIVCSQSQLALAPLPLTALAAGFALGPVYPVMIGLSAQRFPHALGVSLGLVAGAGAAGGFCVPWLIGVIADHSSVATAIGVLGAHALVVSGAALALQRRAQPAS
jgi:fucose permease